MIIDSHAHYTNNAYAQNFRYLTRNSDGYALSEGDRDQLFHDLLEAVPHIPMDRILLETDAPYILPYCKDVIQPKLLRRARNTSLILPAVARKIGERKCLSQEEVENATTENTIRLFQLPISAEETQP
ncbi:MAG: TatD family hydrolase [Oscillospiraceae bacterium]|nr:TatD family hydrolase [Oscillospiraceae bacterium]